MRRSTPATMPRARAPPRSATSTLSPTCTSARRPAGPEPPADAMPTAPERRSALVKSTSLCGLKTAELLCAWCPAPRSAHTCPVRGPDAVMRRTNQCSVGLPGQRAPHAVPPWSVAVGPPRDLQAPAEGPGPCNVPLTARIPPQRGGVPSRSLAERAGRTAPQRKARRRRGGGALVVPGVLAGVGAAGYGAYHFRASSLPCVPGGRRHAAHRLPRAAQATSSPRR